MSSSIAEARAMRATGLVAGSWRAALVRSIRQWIHRITSAWRLRRDVQALRALDDRMLSDIGLNRESLEYAARYGHLPRPRRRPGTDHRRS